MEDREVIWKKIPSYPDYEASSDGKVRRIKGLKILPVSSIKNPQRIKSGLSLYKVVHVRNRITKKSNLKYLHVLIAETFLNYKCEGQKGRIYEIDHINDDPTDNRVENLRIITRRQNAQKAAERKRISIGAEITEPNIYKRKNGKFFVKLSYQVGNKRTHMRSPMDFETIGDAVKWRNWKSSELDSLDKFLGEWKGVKPYDE